MRKKQSEILCSLSDLEATGAFGIEREGEYFGLVAVRFEQSARVYVNRCPHIGTPLEMFAHKFLDETGQQLVCSTHGARFNVSDGVCVSGPCLGEALQSVKIQISGQNIALKPPQPEE